MSAGERWDVVIRTKSSSATAAFWIYARTVGFCNTVGASEQLAVLLYQGGNGQTPPTAAPGLLGGRRQLPLGTVSRSRARVRRV